MDTEFFVLFNISSLFANISLDETISICANCLYHGHLRPPSFPEYIFIELIGSATKSISFRFNDTMYREVDGILMGSPLMANVFMGFLEWQLFDKVHKPYCYSHYVDVTFACFSLHNKVLKLFFARKTFIHLWLLLWKKKITICDLFLTCWLKRALLPLLLVFIESQLSQAYTLVGIHLLQNLGRSTVSNVLLIRHWWFVLIAGSMYKFKEVTEIFLRNGYPDNIIFCIRLTISKFNTIQPFGPS